MRYFKLDEENGTQVVSFEQYGPGLRAGVMEGDLIVGLDTNRNCEHFAVVSWRWHRLH